MIRLIQIAKENLRRVALVEEFGLRCLVSVDSTYSLAQASLSSGKSLSAIARELATGELLDYDSIYLAKSEWRMLCPIDVPEEASRVLVSGTGLTHLGSAKDRQAMHAADTGGVAEMTDSMRIFQWGLDAGRPKKGEVGVAPEWFYKGNGSILVPPLGALDVPSYAEDGGEEAEIAGIYIIGADGNPYRIGYATGNEFSDHKFEKRNYLNLAGSKLRRCSIGPELVIGAQFESVSGLARIERSGKVIWEKQLATGDANMCHSLANLEHHHFKFEGHRQPGSIHVHFFGAYALSFGDGVELQNGDWMQIQFDGFGRALRNSVHVAEKADYRPISVIEMS
jgi:hypothetical protein